jgi:hypothetical protein
VPSQLAGAFAGGPVAVLLEHLGRDGREQVPGQAQAIDAPEPGDDLEEALEATASAYR